MKPVKGYRYVKQLFWRLSAKLLLFKTTPNGPAPCVPSPKLRLVGVRTSYIYFFNISWTLSSGPHYKSLFASPLPWLHPVTIKIPGQFCHQLIEIQPANTAYPFHCPTANTPQNIFHSLICYLLLPRRHK